MNDSTEQLDVFKAFVADDIDEDQPMATVEDRKRFLSMIMGSMGFKPLERLKACDQLSKIEGDYVVKTEIKHSGNIENKITKLEFIGVSPENTNT